MTLQHFHTGVKAGIVFADRGAESRYSITSDMREKDYFRAIRFNLGHNLVQTLLGDIIIGIYKPDIPTLSYSQPCISGTAETTIGLMNRPYTLMLPCQLIAERATAIGRSVIDQYDFVSVIVLRENTIHTSVQIILHIINGNNDR